MTLWNYLQKLEQELRQRLFSWRGLGLLGTSMLVVLVVLQIIYPFGLD
jgi:hypothetical protein